MLRMQPGANVDADALVGVAVGMVVDVGVGDGVDSSAVTGVFVAVGVGVEDAPSIAANLLFSALMSPCSVSTSLRNGSVSCNVPAWSSSASACSPNTPTLSSPVGVWVGCGGASVAMVGVGVGTSARVVVGVGVSSSVAETCVDVGVGGTLVGVWVGSAAACCAMVGVGVSVTARMGVGSAVANTLVAVGVSVAVGVWATVGVAVGV